MSRPLDYIKIANLAGGRRLSHHATPGSQMVADVLKDLVEKHGFTITPPDSLTDTMTKSADGS